MDKTLCPSCGRGNIKCIGSISAVGIFAGRTLEEPLSGGNLYQCLDCFLQFRFPKPDKHVLDLLYSQGDEANWQTNSEDRNDWDISSEIIQSSFEQPSVLDVGCFTGEFLSILPESFHKSGIEIHKEAALVAQKSGIQIIGHDFDALDGCSASYEVVVAMDVIEHVEDPLGLLKRMASATRPGGLVILSTGNTQATSWRLMGSHYWYCTIAEHIAFICPQWCDHVANECGLKVERLEKFSHSGKANRTFPLRLKELARNLFFRISPSLSAWLRERGLGKTDVSSHPSLKYCPPGWLTAEDHFVVVFRRTESADES